MDTNTLLIIVVALLVVVVAAVAVVTSRRRRSEELKERFGPEYDHAVQEYGDPHKAEQELNARAKRVEAFNLRALAPGERERFSEEWRTTQAEFVDDPDKAIQHADRLVKQVMQARGYPVGDFEQRAADISVDHPNVVNHYRTAHDIAIKESQGKASTEDLRQAMVHYRALFEDLLQPDAEQVTEEEQVKQKERTK